MRSALRRLSAATADLTPERAGLLVAVGFVLGTFPVLGSASLLCAAAALFLRLNMPALQAIGQIATPAQYALLLPFARIGRQLIGVGGGLGNLAVRAVAGWICVGLPLGVILYYAVVTLLRHRRRATPAAVADSNGVGNYFG